MNIKYVEHVAVKIHFFVGQKFEDNH
jgi:hypothetical protein